MDRRMLTRDDEAATGSDEIQVRREDQDKINRFSRLHQHELTAEDRLRTKSKEKEELDDITNELELADEDELVPYKIGDAFFHVSLSQAQEMLESSSVRVVGEISELEQTLGGIREEMKQLKVDLYARFGRTINLET